MTNSQRFYELDGLRGIAALIIVIFHYCYHYNNVYGHEFIVPEWFGYGYYGVHLFFLISGFVIIWTLTRTSRPLDFIWNRFSRLYPVYWASIILTFFIVFSFGLPGRDVSTLHFFANFSMLHEYLGFKHVDSVYWTLTIELAFYFWMLILFIFDQIKHIEKWLLLWISVGTIFMFFDLGENVDDRIEKFFILEHIPLFASGISFFKIWANNANKLTYTVLIFSLFSLFMQYSIDAAIILSMFYLLFTLAIHGKIQFLTIRPLVFLGSVSYSFYIIHQNIGYIIIRNFYERDMSPYLGIFSAVLTSFTLAIFLTFIIEKPCLKFLRFHYKDITQHKKISSKFSLFNIR